MTVSRKKREAIFAGKGHGKSTPGSGRDWLLGLLLAVAVILAYQQTWHAGFIWDDDAHLTENPCIVGDLGIKGIWTTSAATYYPLVLTSFWVLHALWGLNPLPFHVVNVLMHAACALLLWRILRGLDVRGAWLGAALWSLHPVMVESVAWITELKNTQSCFFYLLAIWCFIKWCKARNRMDGGIDGRRYALVLFCALLAILSKSSTVVLPVILGLCWWWLDRRWRWQNVAWLSPFLIVSLAASAWTIWEQKYHSGALGPEWNQSLPERIVIAGKAIWFYLAKLVWPHPLTFIYPRWQIDALNPLAYLPFLAAVGGLLVLWLKRNGQSRPLFFAATYFVAALFPVLGFFSVYYFRYSFVGDHLQYLASIGPIVLAGAGIDRAFEFFRVRAAFLRSAMCGALLSVLGFLTWQQCTQYADAELLYRATISRNPSGWLAYNNLGMTLAGRGQVDEAIGYFQKSLGINPENTEAHYNLGIALAEREQYDDAIAHYRKALEIKPDYAKAHSNLGAVLAIRGQFDEAIAHFQKALEINPDFELAHYNFGLVLAGLGQVDNAIAHFQKALELATQQNNQALAESIRNALRLYEAGTPHQKSQQPPLDKTSVRR